MATPELVRGKVSWDPHLHANCDSCCVDLHSMGSNDLNCPHYPGPSDGNIALSSPSSTHEVGSVRVALHYHLQSRCWNERNHSERARREIGRPDACARLEESKAKN